MAVGIKEPENLLAVDGVKCSAISAGIKSVGRKDMVMFEIAEDSKCAAVFTKNVFCAAPVIVAKEHLAAVTPRYLLINSGNANAGTGKQGLEDALSTCQLVAQSAGCKQNEVLPFSTGVIGEALPMDRFGQGIPQAYGELSTSAWMDAARGIMTTDTILKGVSRQIEIDGKAITVTGISKGSGMIRPDMATMLAFIATDAAITSSLLDECLHEAVDQSFNAITVDGDTSTNDACVLIATGRAGNETISSANDNYAVIKQLITEVCIYLAQAIIRDGEGATKFITVEVTDALNTQAAKQVAYTVAHSPLVKTALFASDPNWGRILAAVGRSGVEIDIDNIEIYLDDVCIVSNGGRASDYSEADGQAVMSQDEISIRIKLNQGDAAARIWTSDLSYEYVKINAEYRT